MLKRSASCCRGDWYSVRMITPPKSKNTARIVMTNISPIKIAKPKRPVWSLTALQFVFGRAAYFFFLPFAGAFFAFGDDLAAGLAFVAVFFPVERFLAAGFFPTEALAAALEALFLAA